MVWTLRLPTCCGLTGEEAEYQRKKSMASFFPHLIAGENRSYKLHSKRFDRPKRILR